MKLIQRTALLILLSTLRLAGAAPEVAWEFDPGFGAAEQGLRPQGFQSVKVLPEGMLQLNCEWRKGTEEAFLRSAHDMFIPYDNRDLGELEVRLKVRQSGVGLKAELRWHRGGRSEQLIPLTPDEEFQSCRIDFAKFQHPKENSRGFTLYLYPLVNVDGVEGQREVILDYIKIGFSEAGATRNIIATAGEKLPDMEALLQSLQPYPAEAADSLRKLQEELRKLKAEPDYAAALALDQKFEQLHGDLVRERRLKEAEEALRRDESARAFRDGSWQAGVSETSTGLFGWRFGNREGLALTVKSDRVERNFFTNRDNTHTGLLLRPAAGTFRQGNPEAAETDWSSSDWRYRCVDADGKEFGWSVAISRLAPGALFTAETKAVQLTVLAGKAYRPTGLLVPCRNGVKRLSPEEFAAFPWREMSENWLLVLCDNGLPAAPWLLTLQHRPESASLKDHALVLHFPKQAGQLGVANLYGVRPLPPDWSKVWGEIPREVTEQCRRLNAVMTAYPWRCEEFFTVDREAGKVRIANRFHYRRAANDWNYPGSEVAPLPPVLTLAADRGYPAVLPENAALFNFDAGYGPWRAVPGNQAEYALPLPDLSEKLYFRTERYPEAQTKSRYWFRDLTDSHVHAYTGRMISLFQNWYFHGFNLASPEEKQFIQKNLGLSVDRYYRETWHNLGRLRLPHYRHGHAERTEPFTGKSYLAYGWKSEHGKLRNYHDLTDFAGFFLLPTLNYAQLSGDWGMIQKHWQPISELYSSMPRRSEWASMAVGTTEFDLVHVIDMAPDSWIASEAMAKLARGVGDRRMEELALCIAAKEAVPLCTALMKREWDMAHNNKWDWDAQIPELGYFDSSLIDKIPWDAATLSTSNIMGCLYTPALLRLYQTNCPEALRRYLNRLEHHYPQWNNFRYLRPGKTVGENGPMEFLRQLMIRDALGVPTGEFAKLRRIGLFHDNERSAWSHPVKSASGVIGLSLTSGAMLVGRDAPLSLADWGKAALRDAEFQFKTNRATVELEAAEPFTLTLHSPVKPADIRVNGAALPAEYDGSRLRLRLEPGVSRVTLTYPGWTPPDRETAAPADLSILLTPEMELCRRERELRLNPAEKQPDYQCGPSVPIMLDAHANTQFNQLKPGEMTLRGIPMRIGTTAVTVGKVTGIPAPGKWKKLYFLHAADRKWPSGTAILRYRFHYEDGSEAVFEAVADQTLTLLPWENTARDQVEGVIADFQRGYKVMTSIDIEYVPPSGSAVVAAITGETANE